MKVRLPLAPCHARVLRAAFFIIVATFLTHPSPGQVAPQPAPENSNSAAAPSSSSAEDPAAQKVVVLSPFEVSVDKDNGYMAQNTLSGTRLNTSLKDTPAAITVFTQEFMNDIGATDVADLAQYAPNTTLDFGMANNTANGNTLSTNDTTFHIRGLPTNGGGNRLVDLFAYNLEEDLFNVERVEASRGPNTLLFGLGTAAGAFNIVTKTADVNRTFATGTVRVGSYNSAREQVDVNAAIIPGKLSVRVNAVVDDKGSWRPHEFNDAKRLAIALRYQISPRASLDVQYEGGSINDTVQRPWVTYDYITDWRARGSQFTATAHAPIPNIATSGLQSVSGSPYYVFTSNTGTIFDWKGMSASGPTDAAVGAANIPMLFDNFKIVPKAVTLGGPGVGAQVNYYRLSAFFRDEVARNLFVQLAYNHHQSSYLGRDINNSNIAIRYDTNKQLPNGSPNPYFMQPYVESWMYERNNWDYVDDYLATVSYKLDLGRIFGRHQLAGVLELRDEHNPSIQLSEHVVQNPTSNSAPEAQLFYRRTYVNLDGPVSDIALADFRGLPINGISNSSNGLPISTAMVPTPGGESNNRSRTETASVVTQSNFWNDHIVVTAGFRQDRSDSYASTLGRGPAYGPFLVGNMIAIPTYTNPYVNKGYTKTIGGVLNVTPWLAAFYDYANSFALPNNSQRMLPNTPVPSPTGTTQDMGLKFDLYHHEVFATVTYYQTKSKNVSGSINAGATVTLYNDIWQTLDGAGQLAANGLTLTGQLTTANAWTYDSASQGWELELTANPTPNWRLYGNFTINQTVDTNYGTSILNYVSEWSPLWLKGNNGNLSLVNGNGSIPTVAAAIATINTFNQTAYLDPNGALELGNSKYAANFRTNYSFSHGFLRGSFLGGGFRWFGRDVIGYTSSNPATRQPITGASNILFDMNLGYRRKISLRGHSYDWTTQLNVSNLFDNTNILITRAYANGSPQYYKLQTLRAWTLSTSLGF